MLNDIFSKKLNSFFISKNFKSPIVIALSGGSDSMALLHLVHYWAQNKSIKIVAITVDHQLRLESSLEAEQIHDYCLMLNIEHHILKWQHGLIETNIQEQARLARYELITKWCQQHSAGIVLTGHHLGDQIEQLVISLTQGAAIYSFNIPEQNLINKILFYRPLLDITKKNLVSYLEDNEIKWWEDDTNKQPKYLRNIIRPLAEKLLEVSEHKRIVTSFNNIKRAAQALSKETEDFYYKHVIISNLGYAKINIAAFIQLAEEIRLSILRKVLINIGRQNNMIRLVSLLNVDSSFWSKKEKNLNGCSIYFEKNNAIMVRDFGRKKPQNFHGRNGVWDNRFNIIFKKEFLVTYCDIELVNKLIKENPKLLDFDNELTKKIKKKIITSLPAIMYLEKLVGIPHIYYYDCKEREAEVQIELVEMVE